LPKTPLPLFKGGNGRFYPCNNRARVITENATSTTMRTCIVQAKRAGDCLIITLPREVIEAEQLTPDTFVKISVEKVRGQNPVRKQEDSLGPDDPWRLLE
jgi:hypothetical protein